MARGLLVSLAFFAMVYGPLSLLMVLAWRSMGRIGGKSRAMPANLLFGMRVFSFAVTTLVCVVFTFPSFWLMERTALDEDAGTFILAGCSLVMLSAGLLRLLRAQTRTVRAVTEWTLATRSRGEAASMGREEATTAPRAWRDAPALLLAGILRPRVLVSDRAAMVLSDDELQVAVRHELGHKRAWDNLKKVLISATPFPGMSSLEGAWREAAELAADDAAVEDRRDALDLASALIKLSRSSKQWSEPALASGLVSGSGSIGFRVQRLLEWRAAGRPPATWTWHTWAGTVLVLSATIVGVASNYGAALVLTHRLTEFLVP